MLVLAVVIVILLIFLRPDVSTYVWDSGVPGPVVGIIASVHGNEPAGSVAVQELMKNDWFKKIRRGSVRIIPKPNPFGMLMNLRNRMNGDLNRAFYGDLNDSDAKYIYNFFKPTDLILDFHEGWGYHKKTPQSLGSTIMANTADLDDISYTLVNKLNETIDAADRKFTKITWEDACSIKTTLACYCANRGKKHILVETTGQNNIQPLSVRVSQVIFLIEHTMSELGML